MEAILNRKTFTVSVPNFDTKRFKGLVKLMGWTITSAPAKERTKLFDPESGEYLNEETMQVIEDSRKGIGINSYSTFDDFAKTMRAL